jgi:hypothetical protein
MSGLDQSVRDLLRQVDADPPYDIDVADVLTRARRQRLRLATQVMAAAAAVVTASAVAVAVVERSPSGVTQLGQTPTPAVTPTPSRSSVVAPCRAARSSATLVSTQGAAGTIRWVVQVRNTSASPCTSTGYPALQVHGPSGWFGGRNLHGGYPDINVTPRRVVVPSGRSLFFIAYWSDVTTRTGCTMFDRAGVTLPSDSRRLPLAGSGCLTSGTIRVGPVTGHRPQ